MCIIIVVAFNVCCAVLENKTLLLLWLCMHACDSFVQIFKACTEFLIEVYAVLFISHSFHRVLWTVCVLWLNFAIYFNIETIIESMLYLLLNVGLLLSSCKRFGVSSKYRKVSQDITRYRVMLCWNQCNWKSSALLLSWLKCSHSSQVKSYGLVFSFKLDWIKNCNNHTLLWSLLS